MSYTRVILCCLETGQHTVKTITRGTESTYLGIVFLNGKWYRGWVNHVTKDEKGCYYVTEDYYTFVFTPAEVEGMMTSMQGGYLISPLTLKLRTRNIVRASGDLTVLGKRILGEILIFDKTR